MYGLLTRFLVQSRPELLLQRHNRLADSAGTASHPAGSNPNQSLGQHLSTSLLHVLLHLQHNRTFAALRQSAALAEQLGWRWSGTHLTALGHGHQPCWDQLALLRVFMHEKATSGELSPLLACLYTSTAVYFAAPSSRSQPARPPSRPGCAAGDSMSPG